MKRTVRSVNFEGVFRKLARYSVNDNVSEAALHERATRTVTRTTGPDSVRIDELPDPDIDPPENWATKFHQWAERREYQLQRKRREGQKAPRARCQSGKHAWVPVNLYMNTKTGWSQCRLCKQEQQREKRRQA